MHITQLLSDLALGLIGGSVGTKVMEPVSMRLYELEPEAERQQEDWVRPGPPYAHRGRRLPSSGFSSATTRWSRQGWFFTLD